jgi:hypothetical protein
MEISPERTETRPGYTADGLPGGRTRSGKLRIPQRSQLDSRTAAAKAFDSLVQEIESDLAPSGRDQLSAIERSFIEAYAGATVAMQGITAQQAAGQMIIVSDLAAAISSMIRVASRLGEQRRARDVTVRSTQTSSVRAGLAAVEGEVLENQGQD